MADAGPVTQPRDRSTPIPQLIGVGMLAWALVPSNPYGYYILLRIVICGLCSFLAVKASELQRVGWVWALGIAAVIYNPIIRVHLNREIWSVMNVLTIAMIAATVFVLREQPGAVSTDAGDGRRGESI